MSQPKSPSKPTGLSLVTVNRQRILPVDRWRIRKAVLRILKDAGIRSGHMEIVVTDDEEIHALNAEFLHHDRPTDVLSFALEEDAEIGYLEGNIIVSAETAAARGKEFGLHPTDELLLYIIHGSLHLVGYDDHQKKDILQMRAKEAEYLAAANVTGVANAPSSHERPYDKS